MSQGIKKAAIFIKGVRHYHCLICEKTLHHALFYVRKHGWAPHYCRKCASISRKAQKPVLLQTPIEEAWFKSFED